MGYRIGSDFIGSSDLQTSTTSDFQVIIDAPSDWTTGYRLYKFTFSNVQACHIKINSGNPIYLKAGQGFSTSEVDAEIWSFVIVESGIDFNWIGAY